MGPPPTPPSRGEPRRGRKIFHHKTERQRVEHALGSAAFFPHYVLKAARWFDYIAKRRKNETEVIGLWRAIPRAESLPLPGLRRKWGICSPLWGRSHAGGCSEDPSRQVEGCLYYQHNPFL